MTLPPYSARDFTISGDTLVTEASDLRFGVGAPMPRDISLVFEDERLFEFSYDWTDRSADGEVYGWRYAATDPHAPYRAVLIIND